MEFLEIIAALESTLPVMESANNAAFSTYKSHSDTIVSYNKEAVKAFKAGKYKECVKKCELGMKEIEYFRKEIGNIAKDTSFNEDAIGALLYVANTCLQSVIYFASMVGIAVAGTGIGRPRVTAPSVVEAEKMLKNPIQVTLGMRKSDIKTRNLLIKQLNSTMDISYKVLDELRVDALHRSNPDKYPLPAKEAYLADDHFSVDKLFKYTPDEFMSMGFTKPEAIWICGEALSTLERTTGVDKEEIAMEGISSFINKHKAAKQYETARVTVS